MTAFADRFPATPALIGMIHLPPLPGFAGHPGIDALIRHALQDLETLATAGFDGVLIENEHDRPHTVIASPEALAAMTRVTKAVVDADRIPITGCEILLNDPSGSLSAAHDAGADFIRTDYFVDRMSRPEYGEFDIDPEGILGHRHNIGADDVLILADVQVKYASMIESRSLAESARLAKEKGADAIVVTGDRSGHPPTSGQLREAAQGLAVLIGSGLTASNAAGLLPHCTGAIVGTALMRDGIVDADAAAAIVAAAGR